MKNRTRTLYRIDIDDGCFDTDTYWLFWTFRAARRRLAAMRDPFATLLRIEHKGAIPDHPYWGTAVACWMLNDQGTIVRFSRRWTNLSRKRRRSRPKKVALTHHGEPYVPPPPPADPDDIPF